MMLSGIFLGKKINFATNIHQKIFDFANLKRSFAHQLRSEANHWE